MTNDFSDNSALSKSQSVLKSGKSLKSVMNLFTAIEMIEKITIIVPHCLALFAHFMYYYVGLCSILPSVLSPVVCVFFSTMVLENVVLFYCVLYQLYTVEMTRKAFLT